MQGVEFEQVHVNISDSYKEMYDAAAALWLEVKEAIDFCKESKLIEGTLAKVTPSSTTHCTLCTLTGKEQTALLHEERCQMMTPLSLEWA